MTVTPIRPVVVKLDQNILHRLKRLADARNSTLHGVMCEAIRQYIVREEKREIFGQDGIRAWNEYQANGLHATLEEADIWLAKLEDGQDVAPPECHV
jgi:predicted transcriptional regulator